MSKEAGDFVAYEGYIDLKYQPDDKDLVCRFYLEPRYGVSFDAAAAAVAAESSIGTWTDVATSKPYVKRLAAHVFAMDPTSGFVDVAYPIEAFESGNIPQLLSSVAGNIFGMKEAANLRLLDIKFPKSYIKAYKGPLFGIEGVRKLLRVKARPLVGTIIKPKMGLNSRDHAQVAYEAWIGGCDIVKDDENLTGQKFNKFKERVVKTLRLRDRAEKQTGERKIYMVNVTAETNEMIKRMRFLEDEGNEYAMVDIITVGWSGLQTLREANNRLQLVLHAHRAGHAAFTRYDKHGIHMVIIAKLCRIIGMDQLHIGTVVGKMAGGIEEIVACKDAISLKKTSDTKPFLGQDWGRIAPTLPVASGGLHPGHFPKLMNIFGNDVVIQAGGGIHGHPGGTVKGAMAARQAVD
ncbi:MAG: type III ribulose-bisphosphate carboxylase, partial [Candidatus Micrarchaeia archaeon]